MVLTLTQDQRKKTIYTFIGVHNYSLCSQHFYTVFQLYVNNLFYFFFPPRLFIYLIIYLGHVPL